MYLIELMQVITNLATVCAAIAAFLTIKSSKNTSVGEFIFDMQKEFSSGYGIKLYSKCWNIYSKGVDDENIQCNIRDCVNTLTFFESLYVMYKKKIIDLNDLDDLFGRRFFVIVNNIDVQEELVGNFEYYLNIYRFHSVWKKYREDKKADLFNHAGENKQVHDLKDAIYDKIEALKDADEKERYRELLKTIYKEK